MIVMVTIQANADACRDCGGYADDDDADVTTDENGNKHGDGVGDVGQ